MTTPAQRMEQLRQEISRHDYLYYVQAKPEISDLQYDQLMQELKNLEKEHPDLVTPDSPTQRVSGQPIEGFVTVRHSTPMLSIDNTYNEAEVREFDTRVRKTLGSRAFHYLVDPKVDGVAARLRYENGAFALAATRGDGERGDDVTANVRTLRSVPLRLHGPDVPAVVEAVGEIYWPRGAFSAFNAQRKEQGLETFANPRNGAAGTLKQLDARLVATRGLAFVAHGIGEMSQMPARRASEVMAAMGAWGLPVNPHAKICKTIEEVLATIEGWLSLKAEVDYETDGMVVKVDELPLREELGKTSKYPRWCIAYKYKAEQGSTRLREVSFNVGRLGTVTPVAHFDAVQLAGTTVVNATLHNFDQVARLGLRVGDTILVEKAGEIIPQVVQVVHDKRPKDALAIEPPAHCPVCNQPTVRDEGGVYLRCVNPECPAQIRQRLEFFAGRDQMDIENLGPAVIDQLVSQKRVTHFADLYKLKKEDLLQLERMGDKSSQNLIDAIAASKDRGLARLVAALGIRHVGSRAAAVLTGRFADIDSLAAASEEELTEIDEIGPAIAKSVSEFFHSPSGAETIERLKQAGLKVTAHASHKNAGKGTLQGQSVVVTGTLENFSRKEAEDAIEAAGGRAASSVSKNTAFVVVGADAGSKADKAKALGVETIDEAEFIRRLGK